MGISYVSKRRKEPGADNEAAISTSSVGIAGLKSSIKHNRSNTTAFLSPCNICPNFESKETKNYVKYKDTPK